MIEDIIALKGVEWVKVQKAEDITVLKVVYINPHRNNSNWRSTSKKIVLTSRKASLIQCVQDMIPKLVDRGLIPN